MYKVLTMKLLIRQNIYVLNIVLTLLDKIELFCVFRDNYTFPSISYYNCFLFPVFFYFSKIAPFLNQRNIFLKGRKGPIELDGGYLDIHF